MRWFWSQPLRRQLLMAILLLLLPVVVATVWSGVSTFGERTQDLRDQSRVTALTTAAYVESDLFGLDRSAAAITVNPALLQADRQAITAFLRTVAVQRPTLLDLVLVSTAGEVIARANPDGLAGDWQVWTSHVVATANRVLWPTQAESAQFVSAGYPVRARSGDVAGVLWFLVSLQSIQGMVAALPLPPGSVVTIRDDQGRILVRSLEPERYVGRTLHEAGDDEDGVTLPITTERVGPDGVRRMYGLAPIGAGPWRVSVGIPMSVAEQKAWVSWARSFTPLGLGLIGWLAIALTLSSRLGASVVHLDSFAQRIATGDFSEMERKPMPNREFAELQQAFDLMLRRFNETRAALDRQMGQERSTRQELQSLQRQVIRQERLAAVGQLVSGVAHEINNPLQAILGFSELLQMQNDVPDPVKADLQLIQKESSRACAIIRNLAMFGRQQPNEPSTVRMHDVIKTVVELRQRRLQTEDIQLCVQDRSARPVLAVLTELQQVLLNFVVNAEQSITMSGRLPGRITVRALDVTDAVLLEVEDTGPGIPPDDESKLFQPFFTTKPVGQGTGLGLSVSYGIIDSLGGRIGYRSADTGGAIFYFELPVATDDAA